MACPIVSFLHDLSDPETIKVSLLHIKVPMTVWQIQCQVCLMYDVKWNLLSACAEISQSADLECKIEHGPGP